MRFILYSLLFLIYSNTLPALALQLTDVKVDSAEVQRLNQRFKDLRTQDPTKAYSYAKVALSIAKRINFSDGIATSYNNLGVYHKQKGDYDEALNYFEQALNIYDSISNNEGKGKALSNIGNIYSLNSDFENALLYYINARDLFDEINDLGRSMQIMNNIGNVYLEKGQDQIALNYYLEVLEIYHQIDDDYFPLDPYSNIGKVYFNKDSYDSALYYFSKSLKKEQASGNKFGTASAYVRIARLQNARANYLQALDASLTAAQIAESVSSKPILMESYSTLAEVYLHLGDIEHSYSYMNQYHEVKDSLFNENSRRAIAELEKNIAIEQKEKEISLLKKEAEIRDLQFKNGRLYGFGSVLLSVLLTALALVIYARFRESRKAKSLLEAQNKKILESKKKLEIQKAKLENWNQHMTDSIEYARSIQEGIMLKNNFQENLAHSFVLFRPKDIVSGDFYWYARKNDSDIIALIDCTGHGVAGAFMTVIANAAMNQIVNEQKLTDPAEILMQMDEKVMDILKQKEVTTKNHSMDIALCKIDHKQQLVTYAGARRALYIVEDGALQEIKGSKYTIGEYYDTPQKSFKNTAIPFSPNQIFYMSSDGYADQFGFETQKKYMTKRFKNLLVTIAEKSMLEQHKSLNLEMQRWQGEMEQTDDMLVIGFACEAKNI
ncbi:MAG: tetratricopeptide (TPR) repeat protein [Marivirga sp.]|jgi:tetratricopeptide (TPR) repeat protein